MVRRRELGPIRYENTPGGYDNKGVISNDDILNFKIDLNLLNVDEFIIKYCGDISKNYEKPKKDDSKSRDDGSGFIFT